MSEAWRYFIELMPDVPAPAFGHLRIADRDPKRTRQRQDDMLRSAVAQVRPGTRTPRPRLRVRWNVRLEVNRKSVAGDDQRHAGGIRDRFGAEADLVHDQAVEPCLAQKWRQVGENGTGHPTNPVDGKFPGIESGPHGQLASQAVPFAGRK